MRNLIIAIPSKGRPFASTFRLVEKIKCPVQVYVHEPEYRLYKENLPEHFEIKTHNENWIGDIRRLIQKEHAEKDNAVLMIDDDISAVYGKDGKYQKSMTELIGNLNVDEAEILSFRCIESGLLELSRPFADIFHEYQKLHKLVGVFFVLNPEVWKKGVTFTDDPFLSEDMDFTAQVHQKGITFKEQPYYVIFSCGNPGTHFGTAWYSIAMANMYAKWGHHVRLDFAPGSDMAQSSFITENVAGFTQPYYTRESNDAIRKTLEAIASSHDKKDWYDRLFVVYEKTKNGPFI